MGDCDDDTGWLMDKYDGFRLSRNCYSYDTKDWMVVGDDCRHPKTRYKQAVNAYATNCTSTTDSISYVQLLQWVARRKTAIASCDWDSPVFTPSPDRKLQEIIAARQAPAIISLNPNRKPLPKTADIREVRARQTLRRVVGEEQYRNFLRHGMVSVQAKSGRHYAIRPGHTNVHVWERGKLVGSLCIQLNGHFPPTDSVVMRVLMVLNQEDEFWRRANKHGLGEQTPFQIKPADARPLPEIIAELKAKSGATQSPVAAMLERRRADRLRAVEMANMSTAHRKITAAEERAIMELLANRPLAGVA